MSTCTVEERNVYANHYAALGALSGMLVREGESRGGLTRIFRVQSLHAVVAQMHGDHRSAPGPLYIWSASWPMINDGTITYPLHAGTNDAVIMYIWLMQGFSNWIPWNPVVPRST